MPVLASEITLNYSGGAANSNPDLSIGGARSSATVPDSVANNIFDDVQGAEVISGDLEYRCIYIRNTNATTDFNNVKIWISQTTPALNEEIDIGIGTSAKGGTEPTIANENTAPAGVTFVRPISASTAVDIGDITASSHKAIWIRRTVNPNAQSYRTNFFVIRVEGTSA